MNPDQHMMTRTARKIAGAGSLVRIPCGISGWLWLAGSVRLEAEAVESLFADGWLTGERDEYHLSPRGAALHNRIVVPPVVVTTTG